jgi:hypothetical protein
MADIVGRDGAVVGIDISSDFVKGHLDTLVEDLKDSETPLFTYSEKGVTGRPATVYSVLPHAQNDLCV